MTLGRTIAAALPDRPSVANARARSKGSHVYDELKEAILSGRLEPGSPIDKGALCDRLGVSRFPVATALNRLAFEKLVVIAPQHGSFVARIALSDVTECMMIRAAIEAETAALAAERAPPALLPALDRGLRYQEAAAAAGDIPDFYQLDVAFHDAVLVSLGLSHAAAILDGLRTRLERIRRILSAPPGRMMQTLHDHAAIRDAIAARDGPAARAAVRRHLDDTSALFHAFALSHPTLFSDTPRC